MTKKKQQQLLLAHRGYCDVAPENTKLAFDLVPLFGFDGMELDVHQTIDGELVIIHDETTIRTSEKDYQISKTKYQTLTKLDFGSKFKIKVPKQPIMTLKSFLDQYLNHPDIKLINIEIKTDLISYPEIEAKINALAQKYPLAKKKLLFSSFNFDSLLKMKQLDPQWKLGFLFWTKKQLAAVKTTELVQNCDFIHPSIELYTKYKKRILALKKPICLWTIRSKAKLARFLNDTNVYCFIANMKF